MDLTTLPTGSSDYTASFTEADNDIIASDSSSDLQAATLDNNKAIVIDPNAIILAEALTDKAISWRIHNCKVTKKTLTQALPMQFLYHYDSLADSLKQAHPLTAKLLTQFNVPMTADEAAKIIGIDAALLASPWHVKVTGSLVVFSEALQLAVRLHWTNTGKATEQLYTKNAADALTSAFKEWHFFGRIDVLYKNAKQTLVSIDEHSADPEPLLTITANSDYQYLPASHALNVIAKLEADKAELPWFEAAILERIE